jgi:hypothetical protein
MGGAHPGICGRPSGRRNLDRLALSDKSLSARPVESGEATRGEQSGSTEFSSWRSLRNSAIATSLKAARSDLASRRSGGELQCWLAVGCPIADWTQRNSRSVHGQRESRTPPFLTIAIRSATIAARQGLSGLDSRVGVLENLVYPLVEQASNLAWHTNVLTL